MSYSARYYCEKCKGYKWMKIEGDVDAEKLTLKCKDCKATLSNVEIKSKD